MVKTKRLIPCVILAVLLAFFRFSHGIIQQDNYVGYARMIPNISQISFFDSRLLPGLPILIYSVGRIVGSYYLAGYIITIASFIGAFLLLYKMTGSRLSVLPLIFPPIMLNLASLIDTELPFIFLTLFAVYLIKNKRLAQAFLIIGVSIWFRLAGFAVLFGAFMYLVFKKDLKSFLVSLPFFAFPVALLMLFNVHYFGAGNPFYQLFTYGALYPGPISIGLVQLGEDVARAYRWGWYRILFSGLAYAILFVYLWLKSFKRKGEVFKFEFWVISALYIFTLSVNWVPFLENLGRYLAPTIPLFWLIFHDKLKSEKWLYFLLPISVLVVLL